ncbi:MAG: hypothetical protein M3O33_07460 [Cyanobacteriota bacterium]|nr:hypothetical protein [Cyanobacteriota bacterium]
MIELSSLIQVRYVLVVLGAKARSLVDEEIGDRLDWVDESDRLSGRQL